MPFYLHNYKEVKKIIIVLLVILSVSCSNKKQEKLPLFNELTFKIYDGEAIGVIDLNIKDQYFKYFNNQLIQVPLFKYIKHPNYEIFIGIPYDTSIDALIKNQLEKQCDTINILEDSLSYYIKYKRDSLYITEYAAKVAGKSLIYISTMSYSRELTDSLFNVSELSGRIMTNDK